MTTVLLRGVVAGYGGDPVLDGVDLTVGSGSLVAVLGASGCGKTTLLRVLAGFHPVQHGEVRLGDAVVAGPGVHMPPERRRVGMVPQEGALFSHLTVAGNVGFGLSRSHRRSGYRVKQMLELVGLPGFGARLPSQLSGGQQQRVALARALAPDPAVVLLDEPFNALDAGLRAGVRADVRAALRAAGTTAVLVTHDQEEALGAADEVAVLRDGRIVQAAAPRQLYAEPADLAVALFVGEAVVLDAEPSGAARVRTLLGELPVAGPPPAGRGSAVLRPEQLSVLTNGGDGVPAVLRGTVFHGHDVTVLLERDGRTLRARVRELPAAGPGDAVRVQVRGAARFFAGPPG